MRLPLPDAARDRAPGQRRRRTSGAGVGDLPPRLDDPELADARWSPGCACGRAPAQRSRAPRRRLGRHQCRRGRSARHDWPAASSASRPAAPNQTFQLPGDLGRAGHARRSRSKSRGRLLPVAARRRSRRARCESGRRARGRRLRARRGGRRAALRRRRPRPGARARDARPAARMARSAAAPPAISPAADADRAVGPTWSTAAAAPALEVSQPLPPTAGRGRRDARPGRARIPAWLRHRDRA